MSHHGAATAWQHEADLAQLARPRAQPVELLGRSLHPAAYQQPEMPRLPGPTIVPARYLHAQPCVSSRPQSFSRRTHVIISDLTRLLAWIAAPHLRAEPTCMTCRQNLCMFFFKSHLSFFLVLPFSISSTIPPPPPSFLLSFLYVSSCYKSTSHFSPKTTSSRLGTTRKVGLILYHHSQDSRQS
jgi:hypothetical protein